MNTNYEALNKKLTNAITAHLLNVDVLPPSTEVQALSGEIVDVVFKELAIAGITRERIDSFTTESFAAASARKS